MKLFKFIVGGEYVQLPSDQSVSVKGIVAVVLAETIEEARQIVREDDWDSRWLEVAQVKVFDLDRPRLVAYAGSM